MVKGIIGTISKKEYEGKTLTSFTLKGQDGWYSVGERPLPYGEGDSIQFNVQVRGKYVYARDITPWVDGGATEAPAIPSRSNEGRSYPGRRGSFQSNGGARADRSAEEKAYWANRDAKEAVTQRRIEIQAARNAAITTASFMFEKELVKVPTKQADKYDAFIDLVEQLTDDYMRSTARRLGVGAADDDGGREAKASESVDTGSQEQEDNGEW